MSTLEQRPQDQGALSLAERGLILHSLGLDRSATIYRNFFSAGPGHSDLPMLDRLVERGLMVRETSGISPDFVYRVTREGKAALAKAQGGEPS